MRWIQVISHSGWSSGDLAHISHELDGGSLESHRTKMMMTTTTLTICSISYVGMRHQERMTLPISLVWPRIPLVLTRIATTVRYRESSNEKDLFMVHAKSHSLKAAGID